ncbi:hypothetical protein EVAR_37391_1 [Eumeta japonica]|uniref:Uncharacterized protein n=1 Tax=Eumeta variegata TaxID=151549 RepID=A0A4C1ZN85_EUMVA|nr:hypothetical protein EVAR_37391_1 [Eumeta japonica]
MLRYVQVARMDPERRPRSLRNGTARGACPISRARRRRRRRRQVQRTWPVTFAFAERARSLQLTCPITKASINNFLKPCDTICTSIEVVERIERNEVSSVCKQPVYWKKLKTDKGETISSKSESGYFDDHELEVDWRLGKDNRPALIAG